MGKKLAAPRVQMWVTKARLMAEMLVLRKAAQLVHLVARWDCLWASHSGLPNHTN